MVKILKVSLSPDARKFVKSVPFPRKLNPFGVTQFSGAEAKENLQVYLKRGEKIIRQASALTFAEVSQKIKESKKNLKVITDNAFTAIQKIGSFVYYGKKAKVSSKLLKQLKQERLIQKIYLDGFVKTFQLNDKLPYLNTPCSEVPFKQYFCKTGDSFILSPRLQMHYIKGENTLEHYEKVRKIKKFYSGRSVAELVGDKIKILNEFAKYTKNTSLVPDFAFSEAEIARVKSLSVKYDAVNELLKKQNIRTNSIEALLYSGVQNCCKPGNILPNKDVMLGFAEVYDKILKKKVPVILSFANTDIGYRFKTYLYDESVISNIEKFRKTALHNIKAGNFNALTAMDNRLFDYFKKMQVAEVYLEKKPVCELVDEMKNSHDISKEMLNQLLGNSKDRVVLYLKDLKNFNRQRYYNASSPLIKCLKEFAKINNVKEAYTEALAFENVKHSPVGLYLKAGFTPISTTKEEIEKTLYKKEGFNYKKNVWMLYKL